MLGFSLSESIKNNFSSTQYKRINRRDKCIGWSNHFMLLLYANKIAAISSASVIAPSYTFVSTVNAFVLRGAKIVFIDSDKENPNMDIDAIEALITPRTKVLLPVHYAGIGLRYG